MTTHVARVLYRVGDVARLRSTDPPVPAIVLGVSPSRRRVRVGDGDDAGQVVRRSLEPAALVQATVPYVLCGIPEQWRALRPSPSASLARARRAQGRGRT